MSDYESIVSEEDISIATDRSETYDPNANDYDFQDRREETATWHKNSDDYATSKLTSTHSPGISRNLPLKSALVKPASINTSPSADQNDDYGDYDEFADDFETESISSKRSSSEKQIRSSPRDTARTGLRPTSSPSSVASSVRRVVMDAGRSNNARSGLLPSTEGLQAEVMLDEISREVVRLRNQQRAVLQERRDVARDKKVRADERRAQYEAELKRYSSAAASADAENRELAGKLRESEKRLEAMSKSSILVSDTNKMYEGEMRRLESLVGSLSSEVDEGRKLLRESRQLLDSSRQEWLHERASLQAEVEKSSMLAVSVQKSIESSESRIAAEKMQLPQHQQKAYDDAMARLGDQESALKDREFAIAAEETRRTASLDATKKEVMEQINAHRLRTENELSAERKELGQLKSRLEAQRAHWDVVRVQEESALEAQRADIRRKEQDLHEARAMLQQQRAELEVGQRLIEPNIRAAERDKEDARALKAQADRVLFSAEEHASAILAAERGLVRREQAVLAAEKSLESIRAKVVGDRRAMFADSAKQRAAQQALDTERFRLHQCSMELALQVAVVKKGISQLARGTDRFALREREDVSSQQLVTMDVQPGDEEGYSENYENHIARLLPTAAFYDKSSAGSRGPIPPALDPSLIHTAISLQDVTKTLKGISAATASQDPALEVLLGPRSLRRDDLHDSDANHEPEPSPRYSSSAAPEYFRDAYANAVEQTVESYGPAVSFEISRADTSRARISDEVAVSTVRSSVQTAHESSKVMASFASKYGVFLGK